jgi:glycosyltransferase involved in cell wall biosynthesis
MRALFVSNHFPTDLSTNTQGIYKRMGLFIDALKGIAQLDMLFFVSSEVEISEAAISQHEAQLSQYWGIPIKLFLCPTPVFAGSKLKQQWLGMLNFYHQADYLGTSSLQAIQAFEACLERQPDLVFIHRLTSMCPAMLTKRSLPPIFFDLDDIEHIKFMRQIRQPPTRLRTLLYFLQVPARWWGELKAIRLTRQTFVCSEHDRRYLHTRWGLSNVVAIPNAIAIPEPQPITAQPTLLLLGGYYYYPNINAANFLIEQVFPLIREVISTAHLIIAGTKPETIRGYGKSLPGVEFTGFVDDLDALYQRSRVVCCPIFSGGGTRVKMIEAAAYGKPIVATRIGAEGLEMEDGKEFLLRDRPQDFADACIELLKNDELSNQLGIAARTAAIKHYDRANIVKQIQQHLESEASISQPNPPYVYQP